MQFDANQKISQIRLYWDQGSLLKQVEVIGSRSRNWPIRDGKDQVKLIARSATSEQTATDAPSFSRRSTKSSDEVVINPRSRGSTTSATGDPHASLSLFAPRDVTAEEDDYRSAGPSYARASSAKPPTRNLTDILGGQDERGHGTPSHVRSSSPAKAGASKNYGPIRLFDEQETSGTSPERGTKGNVKRQNHFEFGDGEEAAAPAKPARNIKHQSQWNFEDFVTPDKPKPKVRTQDKRTMSWEETEGVGLSLIELKARPLTTMSRARSLQYSVHLNTKLVQTLKLISNLLTMARQLSRDPSSVLLKMAWVFTRTTSRIRMIPKSP